MHTPCHFYLVVVCRIIHYLKGTYTCGLCFPARQPLSLISYSDVDWAGCPDTQRYITGWFMFLGHVLISWKSKK